MTPPCATGDCRWRFDTVASTRESGGAEVTGSGAGRLTAGGELWLSNAVNASVTIARTPMTAATVAGPREAEQHDESAESPWL